MGLRCLLGHEYANREVEREREERGNEVVVTYRTVETCDRCGERRVVSENKEVRPVRDPHDDGVKTGLGGAGGVTADVGEAGDGATAPTDAADEESPAADAASTEDGDRTAGDAEAEARAEAKAEAEAEARAEADPDPGPDPESTTTPDPDEEDAVILDGSADADDDGRGHGEWPGAGAERPDESVAADASESGSAVDPHDDDGTTVVNGDEEWPDPRGEDEGFDAKPGDGSPADVSFGGGLAPEEATGNDAAANGTDGAVAGKQFVAAEGIDPVGEESTGETEFFCPNCGYVRAAGGSSMRAGDICPDCHEGYIAERERAK